MLAELVGYFQERTFGQLARDALDVLIVYYVFYRALLVLRGTRAMQVGVGLGVVFLLYLLATLLQLVTVLSVLGALISSIILVIVVVFQNDIRRGLQRVGSRALFGSFVRGRESMVIDEVVEAATELARHRIGAIIAFEQDANLDEFVGAHKGHLLDASISSELLVSLFVPEGVNKLHDGAVIIRNYRIAKAGVFFPMPEAKVADESFGSRHRAAMGITEETDAVVVVVSEERGTISFCFNGNIAANLDGPKLRAMLEAIFSPRLRSKKRKARRIEAAVASVAPSERGALPRASEPSGSDLVVESKPPVEEERHTDSEPPPPLRPRVVSPESEGVPQSIKPPPVQAAAPLRTPVARSAERVSMPRVSDPGRAPGTDEKSTDSKPREPEGGRK